MVFTSSKRGKEGSMMRESVEKRYAEPAKKHENKKKSGPPLERDPEVVGGVVQRQREP
jgi:hypothetical protein